MESVIKSLDITLVCVSYPMDSLGSVLYKMSDKLAISNSCTCYTIQRKLNSINSLALTTNLPLAASAGDCNWESSFVEC